MGGRWPKKWEESWYLYCGIGDVCVVDEVGDTEEKPRKVVDVGSWFEILSESCSSNVMASDNSASHLLARIRGDVFDGFRGWIRLFGLV